MDQSMGLAAKFEIHYYLNDDSHSVDAFLMNKCEAEFLAVATEVAAILGVEIVWEAEALGEGGVREVWAAIGKNSAQIALVVSTLALIWSMVPKTDRELIELQKEETRLSIEEKKLSIQKLKNEIEESKVTEETLETAGDVVCDNYKVVTRRSNFYRVLSGKEKVNRVGFSTIDIKGRHLGDERVVEKSLFYRFVLLSNDLEPVRHENAKIEIVSPVLIDGKAKWKGIYEKEHISFSMEDSEFKNSVISRQIAFKNGSKIVCVLLMYKKVDELGDVVTSGYSVEVVLENFDEGIAKETAQGKRYRHTKKLVESQDDLFKE